MESQTTEALLQCPTCRNVLSVNREVTSLNEECPVCHRGVDIKVFPRLFREPVRKIETKAPGDDEAACTFFPELKADKVCDECGCLMSEKASARWGDEDICLPCLHRLREEVKSPPFLAKSALNDNRALALVTLLAPMSLITAPVALWLLLRNRKGAAGIFPRSRWRWWLALILSIGLIIGWTVLLVVWASLILEEWS
ncbi:MAG: hypothetical protein P1U68_12470 [Verrucomicrobiales bacterium]|nr:hypothetical protein [Verrucomicrobiales bacterium]